MVAHRASVVSSLLGVALLGSAGLRRGESAEPAPRPLWKALTAGEIQVITSSCGGADSVDLCVSNLTASPLTLDVNGALIVPVKMDVVRGARENDPQPPRFQQTQPLGVGLIEARAGNTTIDIAPGSASKVRLLTCCLNSTVPSPDASTPLTLARRPAPPAAAAVLGNWRAHPERGQGAVQNAVWAQADPLAAFELESDLLKAEEAVKSRAAAVAPGDLRTRERAPSEIGLPEGVARVLVVSGAVAALTSAHVLYLAKDGEPFRAIARDVLGVAADRSSLYALLAEAPRTHAFAVAQLDLGTEAWGEELPTRGGDLLWARPGAAIVERDGRLVLVERRHERRLFQAQGATVVASGSYAAVLAPGEGDGETRIALLDWTSTGVEMMQRVVRARLGSACCTAATVYARDEEGRLVRIRWSGTWHAFTFPGDFTGMGGSASLRRLAPTAAGLLLETDKGPFQWRPGGPPHPITCLPACGGALPASSGPETLVRDAATGVLFGFTGRALYRFNDAATSWEAVRAETLALR